MNREKLLENIKAFGFGPKPVGEFTDEFIAAFAVIEGDELDDIERHILVNLFEDVDSYDPIWTPEDEAKYPYRIMEPTLREEARKAIKAWEEHHSGTK